MVRIADNNKWQRHIHIHSQTHTHAQTDAGSEPVTRACGDAANATDGKPISVVAAQIIALRRGVRVEYVARDACVDIVIAAPLDDRSAALMFLAHVTCDACTVRVGVYVRV